MPNDPLIEAIARAINNVDPLPLGYSTLAAQAALAAIRDSGHVILPNDWIRRKMPRIDPGGGGLLNEVPLDEEVHCCQWTLYQERERVNAEFDKLVGIEPPAAALAGRE